MSGRKTSILPVEVPPGGSQERIATLERQVERLQQELIRTRSFERRMSVMLEATPGGVLLADVDGHISFANKALLELFGFDSVEQIKGQNLLAFMRVSGKKVVTAQVISQLRKNGRWCGELSVTRSDGAQLVVFADCIYVNDDRGVPEFLVGAFRDLSMLNQLEAQLRQSQKMEAIGTLAGGVAHDMNNVLGAIFNLATLIKLNSDHLDSSQRQDVEDILYAAKRGRDLSRDLLGFARKGKFLKQRLNVNDLIEDTRKLLFRTVKGVEIQVMVDEGLPMIEGDYGQLSHALMNVCINAADAMEGKGVITVTTRKIKLDGLDLLAWPQLNAGRYVRIEVIDNGSGMDKHVLAHVFDPFFSTKDSDRGTGLGLSMVYGTVKNHGGAINIHSEKGAGTRVTILLPLSNNRNTPLRNSGEFEVDQADCHGEILLVDDEQMIRRSASRLIKTLGYEVSVAANGVEAMEVVEERGDRLRLIILDLIMPVMDGAATFANLKARYPEIPVLISSGYAKGEKVEQLINSGARGFVQKPFELKAIKKEIARLVRSVS